MVQLISTSDAATLLGVKGGGIIFEIGQFWFVRGVKNFFAFVEACSGRHQVYLMDGKPKRAT